MKEKLEKLYKELSDLRKESDSIHLKIKQVRDQITKIEEAYSCKNLEDFTKLFKDSGGKIVKVHRHTLYAIGKEYHTYYIGTVLSEEEKVKIKQEELEDFGEMIDLLPTRIPIKNTICVQEGSVMDIGDWEISYDMLYTNSNHETYQVEFITKEEANEFIMSHIPKL